MGSSGPHCEATAVRSALDHMEFFHIFSGIWLLPSSGFKLLSQQLHKNRRRRGISLFGLGSYLLNTARKSSRVATFLEGEAGVYCVAGLLGRLQKKDDVVYELFFFYRNNRSRILTFLAYSATYLGKLKSMHELAMSLSSNELLYGKGGERCEISHFFFYHGLVKQTLRFRISVCTIICTQVHQARRCRAPRLGNEGCTANHQGRSWEKVRFCKFEALLCILSFLMCVIFHPFY